MAGHNDVPKYKLTLSIELPLARKFGAFAAFTGEDQSAIVARLIRAELRGFSISRKGGRDDQTAESEAGPIRLAGPPERESA